MNGGKLTKKILDRIEKKYLGVAVNVIVSSRDSVDILACIEGMFYALEIKGEGDREKEHQKVFLDYVIKAGGKAGFVYNINDLDCIITESQGTYKDFLSFNDEPQEL